jgi:diguanylate cyclase (GGDEF)-like protein
MKKTRNTARPPRPSSRPRPASSSKPPPAGRHGNGRADAIPAEPPTVRAFDEPLSVNAAGVPVVWEEAPREGTETDKTAQFEPNSVRKGEHARFMLMTGQAAGMVIALDREITVIGRGREADISLADTGLSRRHCEITREEGRYLIRDLGSTNGTVVNGRRVQVWPLRVGDRVQLGPNVVLQFALFDETEETLARRLYEASTRDALTGAFNRRFLLERLDAEISYAHRHASPLTLLVIDLDHFKQVNDRHGHEGGDAVLREFSALVMSMIRVEDVFGRIGGEEFVLVVRGISRGDAERFAERLRNGVERLKIGHRGEKVAITVSIGLAHLHENDTNMGSHALLRLADRRLYEAKGAGRNCVR